MGSPVEQQKYQALASLRLTLDHDALGPVTGYRRWLDLATGVAGVMYTTADGIAHERTVVASAIDQTVAIHLSCSKPGGLGLTAMLRGERNRAHSNYGTDYFRMDGVGTLDLGLTQGLMPLTTPHAANPASTPTTATPTACPTPPTHPRAPCEVWCVPLMLTGACNPMSRCGVPDSRL